MNVVITILSTIILAVTVLTLFLGILAYIVYKVRKRASPKQPIAEVRIEPTPVEETKPRVNEAPTTENAQPPPTEPKSPSLLRRYQPKEPKESRPEWK